MPTCFVIQPFDSGKYDKRFEDVYRPAIIAAGLDAYRVDLDPGVEVPIDAIEEGIRSAAVCLADITTDNPNVWYELGYAFAAARPVVMVCSDERSGRRYPFDIQHRTIIPYQADSPRDFETLKESITTRLKALLERTEALQTIRESEQIAPVHGLSQPELAVIAAIAGSVSLPDEGVSVYALKRDVERAGFTALGFSLGLRRLREKKFVELGTEEDERGERYQVVGLLSVGWNWIEANEEQFLIRKRQGSESDQDEVPF
jgi:hypothetical protein